MKNINFKPWVGKNYQSTGYHGKRILVLGESHYCQKELSEGGRCYPFCKRELMNDACFSQTHDVVDEAVYGYSGQRYLQAFVCFERAVTGRVLTNEERKEFWESVMFYNYIQYAQSGPRMAPQSEHWAKSEKAFVELLETYKPDYIIVWGVRLYDGLPSLDGKATKHYLDNNHTFDTWHYTINGNDIPALKIHHPSSPSGRRWSYWHTIISEFLK